MGGYSDLKFQSSNAHFQLVRTKTFCEQEFSSNKHATTGAWNSSEDRAYDGMVKRRQESGVAIHKDAKGGKRRQSK
jgi:hypothetical protein